MGLRGRWVTAMVVGELVGFVPPAVVGSVLASAGVGDAGLVAGLVVAGAMEGAVLGAAQARVVRAGLPGVRAGDWVLATAAAAALCWAAGMGGAALIGAYGTRAALLLVPVMVAALLSMGGLQALVLRPHVGGAGRWVWVTTGAWLVGVMLPVAALSLWPAGWPVVTRAAVAVLAAVAMGATVGLLSAGTLARLVASRSHRTVPTGSRAAAGTA
jgi:hypothetical protein